MVNDKRPTKLFPIIRGRRFGFIDQTGHVVISPQFLWASQFSEGRATVFVCHKYGYIDESGKIVIPPQFDGAGKFSEGLALVLVGKKVGFIDKTGRMPIAAVYDSSFDFADGEAGAYVNGREGLIDKTGRWLVPNRFDELLGFSEGVSAALEGNRWGFVDKSGRTVIPFEFKSAGSFADSRAHVTTFDGQDDVIDHSGRVVIRDATTVWGFSEGLAPVQLHGEDSYRYIDVSGKVAIAGPFDSALPFSEGLAVVQIGEEWGYIDHAGKAIIQPQFEAAHDFSHGLAAVKLANRWGVIDKTGKFVVQPQFAEILGAPGEFLQVSITRDEWGYIDPQGELFWRAPESERPRYFEHDPLEGLTQEEINASCTQPSRQILPNDPATPD